MGAALPWPAAGIPDGRVHLSVSPKRHGNGIASSPPFDELRRNDGREGPAKLPVPPWLLLSLFIFIFILSFRCLTGPVIWTNWRSMRLPWG